MSLDFVSCDLSVEIRVNPWLAFAHRCGTILGRFTGGVSAVQPMSDSAWLTLSLDHPPESRKTENASMPPFKRLPNPCESATSTADILPASPGVAVPPATAMRHCRYLTGRNVDARSTRVSPAPPDWLLVTGYWLLRTCGQTQASAAPDVARVGREAARRPAEPGEVAPAAATKHTGRA